MKSINAYAQSVYSQFGEDGIIEELLNRIATSNQLDGWCVEFGALDGINFSNTYNLIKHKGYQAVLIEGDKNKYKELCKNIPQEVVIKICQFISLKGQSSIDSILQGTPTPTDFDLLSIDIDGCDYHIFESLEHYKPKIVCIEFNPTVPNEIDFTQPADFAIKQGSSAKALVRLASQKGYFLAATTFCNLIFVRVNFIGIMEESELLPLETLRDDTDFRTFIFFGYDGTLLSNKQTISIPWHRITIHLNQMQYIPSYLRKFGEDYNFFQKIAFGLFVLVKFPWSFRGLLQDKVINKFLRKQQG